MQKIAGNVQPRYISYISNIPGGDGSLNIRQIPEDHLRDYLAHIGQIDWLKIVDVQK